MKKRFARYIWLLAIGMLAILLAQCHCNNPSREKLPKPVDSPNPPNPPGTHGGAMVKRAKEKGGSDFLIKKLQEAEGKVVGMNINERQAGTQNTALHEAVSLGDTELIKYLLANHADRKAKNSNNETAFDIASKQGFAQSLLDELHREPEGSPSTSGTDIDPTAGNTDSKNSSPYYSTFIKGDCGHDEYTCENIGEPGHGHYETFVAPGITLQDHLKMLEEQKRQEDEKLKRELEESQKQTYEQEELLQEHLKFKNGKIFNPNVRTSDVEEIKLFIEGYIERRVKEVDVTTPLDEEFKQHLSYLVNDISQKLKDIKEEIGGIEKCLSLTEKSPHINYEQEKKDLVLAKQLVKDLEGYQEELCTLLASRRKELNNPQLEAAYKEVEQRKAEK